MVEIRDEVLGLLDGDFGGGGEGGAVDVGGVAEGVDIIVDLVGVVGSVDSEVAVG